LKITVGFFNAAHRSRMHEIDVRIVSQIQPQFPPLQTKDNCPFIDWGSCGLIAYSAGPCIQLCRWVNPSLIHLGSIEISPNSISCFRFHPLKSLLAIGDSHGRLFVWCLNESKCVASYKPLKSKYDPACAVEWYNDALLVLPGSRRLAAFDFATDSSRTLNLLWEISVPRDFVRISIDPHYNHLILLSSASNSFALYYIDTPFKKPDLCGETIDLTQSVSIIDAQWSIHFPGYLFLLLDRDLLFFHIQNQSLIPLLSQNAAVSPFKFMVQFSGDHSQVILCQRNGILMFCRADEEMWFSFSHDFQSKTMGLVSATVCPMDDNLVAFFHQDQGIGLLDLIAMKITSMDLTFPSEITAFDSDMTRYIVGTANGFIMVGNLFDTGEIKRFKVADEEVAFVAIDAPLFRVYWQTPSDLGVLDIGSRFNSVFKSKGSLVLRSFGSHRGGLIVMRDLRALGVFIDRREWPLLFQINIVDVSISEEESTQSTGRFCVLLKSLDVIYYSYSVESGPKIVGHGIKQRAVESEALCIATKDNEYVIGFKSGLLLFVNTEAGTARRVITETLNISCVRYGKGDDSSVFALCGEDRLFQYRNGQFRFCEFEIKSFKVVSETLLMVKANDSLVKFVTIADFQPLSVISKYCPPPSDRERICEFAKSKPSRFFHPYARDPWLVATGRTNVRLQATASDSPYGQFEKLNLALLSRGSGQSDPLRFMSLLFLDRFDEAAHVRDNSDPRQPEFLKNSLMNVCLLTMETTVNERAQVLLKRAAIDFFNLGNWDEGVILLRMGRLDREAADYLIDVEKFQMAVRFLRSVVKPEDRQVLLFKLGVKLWEASKGARAISVFSAVRQFHPVLFILLRLGLVVDAHFLMVYVTADNQLTSCTDDQMKIFAGLASLTDISTEIEENYQLLMEPTDDLSTN
jgi:WD40 repeat protein